MGLFKRLFKRNDEIIYWWLEENVLGKQEWIKITEPAFEGKFSKDEYVVFFEPGRQYRLIGRDINTGRLKTKWYHYEKDYGAYTHISHGEEELRPQGEPLCMHVQVKSEKKETPSLTFGQVGYYAKKLGEINLRVMDYVFAGRRKKRDVKTES